MKIIKKAEYHQIQCKAMAIKKQIDQLIENKCYIEVSNLLDQEESRDLAGKDAELFALQIINNIHKQEQKLGRQGIFCDRKVCELVDIYEQIVLFLRRIEFDFPEEYQNELLGYMVQQKLSWICVVGVAQGNPYILDKEKVINKFLKMMKIM
mgnify:CR=1 FL=1